MSCPLHHRYLTDATNKLGEVCCLIEQASYDDKSYEPLLEATRRLHKKLTTRWGKNCKIGKKEGWFE